MKLFLFLFTTLLSMTAFAQNTGAVYLVAPETVEVVNASGTSCLAAQNGQSADLSSPHFRMPISIVNPQGNTFTANLIRVVVFVKGQVLTCEVRGEALAATGLAKPLPFSTQLISQCDVTCGGVQVPMNRKFYGTVEVYGEFEMPDGSKKTGFQETGINMVNYGSTGN